MSHALCCQGVSVYAAVTSLCTHNALLLESSRRDGLRSLRAGLSCLVTCALPVCVCTLLPIAGATLLEWQSAGGLWRML